MIQFIEKYAYYLIILFALSALLFIVLGHKYRKQIQLLLKNDIATLPPIRLDWWSVSHFVLFAIFGFIKPNHHISFILLGILFEMTEDFLASDKHTQLSNCKCKGKEKYTKNNKGIIPNNLWCRGLQDDYWYAKYDDVIVNTFGYVLGSGIRTSFFS